MKAEELMIGDWVKCVDSTHKKKVYAQVIAIEEGQCILVEKDNCNWFLDISFLEPIPLTKEILEMNGFYSTPNVGYVLDDYNGNVVIYDDWNHILIITKYYKTVFDMEYFNDMNVHELQHALRLCGIDKEIKMEDEK